MSTASPQSQPQFVDSASTSRLRSWLLGFRRVTASTAYIPEVDGFRFVALTCVLIFHLAGDVLRHSPPSYRLTLDEDWFFWLTQRLNFGVQLFFVVSGFVLALPFATRYLLQGPPVSLRRYLLRRVTRLEPPYIVALLLFFCLKLIGARGSAPTLLPHFWASVGYVHNLVYGVPSDINFVAWSLEIEVQFYLLAPLLTFLFFQPKRHWVRRTFLVFAMLFSAAIPLFLPPNERIGLSLLGQFPYFLAGILLADVYVVHRDTFQTRAWWGDVFAVGSGITVLLLLPNQTALTFLGPLVVFAGYFAVFKSRYVRRVLSLALIATIGGMCYSIYLLHNYVIACAGYLTEPLSSGWPFEARLLLQFVLLSPLVLGVSGVFFKLIEQPCMKPDWPLRTYRFVAKIVTPASPTEEMVTTK